MNITKIIPLKENENVVREVRPYFLRFFWSLGLALIFLLPPFFFIYPLFRYGILGIIIFSCVLLIGLALLIRVLVIWYFNIFVITNKRVIIVEQKGLFERSVGEVSYGQVVEISYKQKGVAQTLWHFGHVLLTINGAKEPVALKNVKEPHVVYQILLAGQKYYAKIIKGHEPGRVGSEQKDTPDEIIKKTITKYGTERVKRVMAELIEASESEGPSAPPRQARGRSGPGDEEGGGEYEEGDDGEDARINLSKKIYKEH